MSLQFCIGPSGSGKSYRLQKNIAEWAQKEPQKNFFYIVPDQFTMQTQVDFTKVSASGGIMNIDVLSFGRLSHRIFEETGMGNQVVLDDTGKSLVLRKVAENLKDELPYIGTNLKKLGYIHEVKSAISEFKQYGLDSSRVLELVEYSKERQGLCAKLRDLQILYAGFEDYIKCNFITTEDRMDILVEALSKSKIIQNSVVVFDGFTGFTPIQYRVIAELLRLTERVIVSVTLDTPISQTHQSNEYALFALSHKTITDLERIAAGEKIERTQDIYLLDNVPYRFKDSSMLEHLEKAIFRYPVKKYEDSPSESNGQKNDVSKNKNQISILEYRSPREEVQRTCAQIRRLARMEGVSYADIAVITGDLGTYGGLFEQEALKYDIPLFVDCTHGILLNPFTEMIRSALKVVTEQFSYEAVFHYLRSGISGFDEEETDRFENYVLQHKFKGKRAYSQRIVRDYTEELDLFRSRIYERFTPLLKAGPSLKEKVYGLYEFLISTDTEQKLRDLEEEFRSKGMFEKAVEYAQIYKLVMDLLNQLSELLPDDTMDYKEFGQILDAGFSELQVGTIPASVDRVIVGDNERTRLKQVKHLFFLGINNGNIPRKTDKGGIISDLDREFLKGSEIELAPTPREEMYTQRLYLYMNMTKPSECLYLSYSNVGMDGKSILPAYLIDLILELFPQISVQKASVIKCKTEDLWGTRDALPYVAESLRAFSEGRDGSLTKEEVAALCQIMDEKGEANLYLDMLEAAYYIYDALSLSKELAAGVYGEHLQNSVSELETYSQCAMKHFLTYGLRLRERNELEFERIDLGNIYHKVLELFSKKLKDFQYTWADFPEDKGRDILWSVLKEFSMEYGNSILYSSSRLENKIDRIHEILIHTVLSLQKQLRKGSFRPQHFEKSFSYKDKLESAHVRLSDTQDMSLRGKIDRIDVCEQGDELFVKIIDYKSSEKNFELSNVYYGQQLQLLTYMNTALEILKKENPAKEVKPAAMLYYAVTHPFVNEADIKPGEDLDEKMFQMHKMSGVVLKNKEIVSMMDKEMDGKSYVVPVEYKKDGDFSAYSKVLSEEDYETASQYVMHKMEEFGKEIMDGNIQAKPTVSNKDNACTYCDFKGVCGFDEKIKGYEEKQNRKLSDEEAIGLMRETLD